MFFKNLQIYRIPAPWSISAAQLEAFLAPQAFAKCSSLELQSKGWLSPRDNGMLVHTVNSQMMILLGTEKKLLPATVVNQVTKERAAEIEDQQGYAPGRKQLKDLKEQVTDELLPRAFSIQRSTWVWIDPVNGWLVIDSGSTSIADDVLKLLLASVDRLQISGLRTVHSPLSSMTNWLVADEAPHGFTVDQDTELRATGEGKATVRYIRHTLEADDTRRHIASGKQCTRLAMTWADHISFVLTESLAIKRIAPLDVLKDDNDTSSKNDAERFDADVMLMTAELNKMLGDLVFALGGETPDEFRPATNVDGQARAAVAKFESHLREHGATATISHAGTELIRFGEGVDPLYAQAVAIVREQRRPSISLVQRHLRITYNRAARLLVQMEADAIVDPMQRDGTRPLLKPEA
jgi:recombination associated protein RdgC